MAFGDSGYDLLISEHTLLVWTMGDWGGKRTPYTDHNQKIKYNKIDSTYAKLYRPICILRGGMSWEVKSRGCNDVAALINEEAKVTRAEYYPSSTTKIMVLTQIEIDWDSLMLDKNRHITLNINLSSAWSKITRCSHLTFATGSFTIFHFMAK